MAGGQAAASSHDRETVAVASAIAAVVVATTFYVARIGFHNPAGPVLRSLGLSLFCCAAPYWMWRWMSGRATVGGRWFSSQPCFTICTVALLALAGFFGGGETFALVIGIAGAALALVTVLRWLIRGPLRAVVAFVAGALVFSGWAAGVVWTSRYKMPLYWETFSLNANVHHDPLYYVAMGNMIEVYGVPSTGLDGTPYIYYHYGSPWLFAQLSKLAGSHLLSFYSLGYAVIMIPLFIAAILLLALEARRPGDEASFLPLRLNGWAWLVLAAGTIGIIPESALFGMAVWNAHVLISESYLAGLPIFLCGLATAIAFWRSRAVASASPQAEVSPQSAVRSSSSLIFLIVFLPALIGALGFLKMSLMALFLALAFYAALRLKLLRQPATIFATLLTASVALVTYRLVALTEQNRGISPFDFMRYHTAEGWDQFFPLIHFAWTWVYLIARLWEEKATTPGALRESLARNRLLDVELLALLAVLGFLPGEILSIHGGSAIYFSDVQRWVAIPLIMSRVAGWVDLWKTRRATASPASKVPSTRSLRAIRLSTILAAILIAPFAVTLALNAVRPPLRLARRNLMTRTELIAQADRSPVPSVTGKLALFDAAALESGVERARYHALISTLRGIEQLPPSERRNLALFIPQSYSLYWDMFSADGRCMYVSFVAPAVAGVALIDGMPPVGCDVTEQYNMAAYEPRRRPQSAEDLTSATLCRKAVAKGFRRVMVLAPDASGAPQRRTVDCA